MSHAGGVFDSSPPSAPFLLPAPVSYCRLFSSTERIGEINHLSVILTTTTRDSNESPIGNDPVVARLETWEAIRRTDAADCKSLAVVYKTFVNTILLVLRECRCDKNTTRRGTTTPNKMYKNVTAFIMNVMG